MGSNHDYLKIKLTGTTATFFYKLDSRYMRRIIYAHPDKLINKCVIKDQKQYEEFVGDLYKFDGDIDNLNKELENFKPAYDNANNIIVMLIELLSCKCDVRIEAGLIDTIVGWLGRVATVRSDEEMTTALRLTYQ